jgi:hypothetical protein
LQPLGSVTKAGTLELAPVLSVSAKPIAMTASKESEKRGFFSLFKNKKSKRVRKKKNVTPLNRFKSNVFKTYFGGSLFISGLLYLPFIGLICAAVIGIVSAAFALPFVLPSALLSVPFFAVGDTAGKIAFSCALMGAAGWYTRNNYREAQVNFELATGKSWQTA